MLCNWWFNEGVIQQCLSIASSNRVVQADCLEQIQLLITEDRRMKNPDTSDWSLNELADRLTITIEVGSLFNNFTTRIEKDHFHRRRRKGPSRTLKG